LLVTHGEAREGKVPRLSLQVLVHRLVVHDALAGEHPRERFPIALDVIGRDPLDERTPQQGLGIGPVDLPRGLIQVRPPAFGVRPEHQVARRLHERAVFRFGLPQRLLGALAVGDVPGDAERADGLASVVVQRRLGGRNPGVGTIGPGLPFFLGHRPPRPNDQLLILVGLPRMLRRKEVSVCLAHRLSRVTQTEQLREGFVDSDEAAVAIFEVDMVRDVIHEGLHQRPLLGQRLLRPLALGQALRRGPGARSTSVHRIASDRYEVGSAPTRTTIGKVAYPGESGCQRSAWRRVRPGLQKPTRWIGVRS